MNNNQTTPKLVEQPDGTFRYPGNMQWMMSRDEQKAAGLIATTSRSISGREVRTNNR